MPGGVGSVGEKALIGGAFMSENSNEQQRPARKDMHPLPGTPEAKALDCKCEVVTGADGKPLYRFEKGCPIRNHN